jgi:hypothetical protein
MQSNLLILGFVTFWHLHIFVATGAAVPFYTTYFRVICSCFAVRYISGYGSGREYLAWVTSPAQLGNGGPGHHQGSGSGSALHWVGGSGFWFVFRMRSGCRLLLVFKKGPFFKKTKKLFFVTIFIFFSLEKITWKLAFCHGYQRRFYLFFAGVRHSKPRHLDPDPDPDPNFYVIFVITLFMAWSNRSSRF